MIEIFDTASGFYIDAERFGESFEGALLRLQKSLKTWFFTKAAGRFAEQKLAKRQIEVKQMQYKKTPDVVIFELEMQIMTSGVYYFWQSFLVSGADIV